MEPLLSKLALLVGVLIGVVRFPRGDEDQHECSVGRPHAVPLDAVQSALSDRIDEEYGRTPMLHHLIVHARVVGDQHPLPGRSGGNAQRDLRACEARGLFLLAEALFRSLTHCDHRSLSRRCGFESVFWVTSARLPTTSAWRQGRRASTSV